MTKIYESARAAANAIGATQATISKWVKAGRLKVERTQHGSRTRFRIRHDDLMESTRGTVFEARPSTLNPQNQTEKVYETSTEAAKAIGKSQSTISHWVKAGKLKAERVPGVGKSRLRIRHDDLLETSRKAINMPIETIQPQLPNSSEDSFYTGKEAADAIGASRQTISRWVRTNQLKATRVIGAGVPILRIRHDDLLEATKGTIFDKPKATQSQVPNSSEDFLYTTEQAAESIGAKKQTISRWVKSGRLKAQKIKRAGKMRIHIHPDDLLDATKGTIFDASIAYSNPSGDFLESTRAAANAIGATQATISNWVKAGKLKAKRVQYAGKSRFRIRREDLLEATQGTIFDAGYVAPKPQDRIYETATEAAEAIGMTQDAISNWVRSGKLKAERVPGVGKSRLRIRHKDLLEASKGTIFDARKIPRPSVPNPSGDFLETAIESADAIGASPTTIFRWFKSGRLKAKKVKRAGKITLLVRRDDLLKATIGTMFETLEVPSPLHSETESSSSGNIIYNGREAADIIGATQTTISKWVKAGKLKAERVKRAGVPHLRIRHEDLIKSTRGTRFEIPNGRVSTRKPAIMPTDATIEQISQTF